MVCMLAAEEHTVLSDQKIQKVARDATNHPRRGCAVPALVAGFFLNAIIVYCSKSQNAEQTGLKT